MILVTDTQGDRVEVGETREDLERFLSETCSDDYGEQVLDWYDGGTRTFDIMNGWEDIMDTWTNLAIEDDDEDDEDEFEDEDEETLTERSTVAA